MTQLTFYKYAIGGLVLLNIAVLTFFLLTKPKPPHHAPPHHFQAEIIDILDLDKQQAATFKTLAKEHHQQMKSIKEQQQQLLLPYFESLTNSAEDIDKEKILNQFQQQEREKIEVTYQHFEEVKKLLNKKQLSHFKQLMKKFIDKLLFDKQKKTPPPKDFE